MARAVFLDYCTGFALDTFAPRPRLSAQDQLPVGTGHGVGFISGVHEGHQSLLPNNPSSSSPA